MGQLQKVLVTGGSQGIGLAVAQRLARQTPGITLVLTARDRAKLEEAKAQLLQDPTRQDDLRVALKLMDVSDPESIHRAMAEIATELGSMDGLVLSAGVAESAPLATTSDEMFDRVMAVNVGGVFRTIRAALPGMIENAFGRIVVLGSVASKVGAPYISAYCASKHAVLGLVRALALEVATKGVTANLVCPGYVDTPMTERSVKNIVAKAGLSPSEARARIAERSPQGRMFSPDEIAAAVCFLLSDEAGGVTGSTIDVEGGELAG